MKAPGWMDLNELASEKYGGRILFATDDWFAAAENLLKDSDPVWKDGLFTEFGKWMDGWETRRKRTPGHDWAIIGLKYPCIIKGCCIDTGYFTGNYAPRISIQAAQLDESHVSLFPERVCQIGTAASAAALEKISRLNSEKWTTIVSMSNLAPGYASTRKNYFPAVTTDDDDDDGTTNNNTTATHLRLNLYPDGGIARLRVYGFIVPDVRLNHMEIKQRINLVARNNGGICIAYSNAHYGHPRNLISSEKSLNMSDGWETARRLDRPPIIQVDDNGILQISGISEWAIFKLGYTGIIETVKIDTTHFKGNFPDSVKIEGGIFCSSVSISQLVDNTNNNAWKTILPVKKLQPHKLHIFNLNDLSWHGSPVSHVRITICPDGGLSRLELWGYCGVI